MVKSTLLNPVKLDVLCQLRETAGLTQTQAARLCGLTSKQGRVSLGAWEQGKRIPHTTRRPQIIAYLWDHLGLRKDPTQFEKVWTILVEEWDWEPIGDREWDRFTKTERGGTSGTSQSGRISSTSSDEKPIRPFQAPISIPHFVGREEELAKASQLLTVADGPSTMAFVGMGGIGKTTLAIHVAHALRNHFTDGILWATAAITNPLDIAQSWATAYGYDFSGLSDLESRAAAIRNVLAEKQTLIVFDDVIDAADVRPLLPGGDSCRVLITTRNHDIASTLHAHPIAPPELATQAGVDLLIRVLGASRVEAEFAAAERICQIVEGLPLAVEIVAQRLLSRPQQTLENMVTRLEDSSQRLGLEISDRAIRAAFEVSWAQLNDDQKEVFSQMGVFEGRSFAIPALAYIGERSEHDTEDLVWELQALSLVGTDGDGRYRQHPLLADFAGESSLFRKSYTCEQLARYYIQDVTKLSSKSELLVPELTTVAALVSQLEETNASKLIVKLIDTYSELYIAQGQYDASSTLFRTGVIYASAENQTRLVAQFYIEWGYICCEQSQLELSQELIVKGLKIAELEQFNDLLAEANLHLARIAIDLARYEEADERITKSHEIYLACENKLGIAKVLQLQAQIFLRVGHYHASSRLCEEAIRIYRASEHYADMIETYKILIEGAWAQKKYDNANDYCQSSIEWLDNATRRDLHGEVYFSYATTCRYRCDYHQALEYVRKAMVVFEELGNRVKESHALYEHSVILYNTGNLRAALSTALKSQKIMTELHDRYSLVFCLQYIGDIYRDIGDKINSVNFWSNAHELAKEIRHPRIELIVERLKCNSEVGY